MGYVKKTWKSGDTITSAALNNIEEGIEEAGGGGAMYVTLEGESPSYQASATVAEIAAADEADVPVFIRYGDDVFRVARVKYGQEGSHPILIKAFTDDAEQGDIGVKRIEAWKDTSGDEYWSVTEKHSIPDTFTATTEEDAQTGKLSITVSITAGLLFARIKEHSAVHLSVEIGDSGSYMECMIPVEGYRMTQGGSQIYLFRCKGDVSDPTAIFQSGMLSDNDTVVLTEV